MKLKQSRGLAKAAEKLKIKGRQYKFTLEFCKKIMIYFYRLMLRFRFRLRSTLLLDTSLVRSWNIRYMGRASGQDYIFAVVEEPMNHVRITFNMNTYSIQVGNR